MSCLALNKITILIQIKSLLLRLVEQVRPEKPYSLIIAS